MSPTRILLVYCALILLASVLRGLIPLTLRLTHRRLQLAVSLVAGIMLGVGLLHMLPHALLKAPDRSQLVFLCVLGGFLAMFFIERFFCFRHRDLSLIAGEEAADSHRQKTQRLRQDHGFPQHSEPGGAIY